MGLTDVILIDMDPDKDCVVVCDFIGIIRDSGNENNNYFGLNRVH